MGWIYNAPDDTPTDGHMITIVTSVLTGVALSFICLRAYVRAGLIHALGIDDWIIFATWLLSCTFTVLSASQTRWGLGMDDLADMPAENARNYGLLEYANWPVYILSVLGFKLSLLVSYFRFVPQGMCKYGVTCVLVSCTLFHVSCLIVQFNLCRPIAKIWDPTIPGQCLDVVKLYTVSSALTIIFDFAVMFLPFPVLIKTKIPTRKKFILLGLFALGFFIPVIQIIRIQYIKDLATANPNRAPLLLWSSVEINLGIIVACGPVLSPLVRRYYEKSNKGTKESLSTARQSPTFMKVSTPSTFNDSVFDPEKSDITRVTSTGSRDSALLKMNQIMKETDIVVLKQVAPAHLSHSRDVESGARISDYECWAQSANVALDHGA
ncbi:hypothetical protein GGR54DRAFT_592894 [Hypoxylon sp. NC1633]|nr:hypothetical protein GGR54DRAFT_592894 [Hypoxylon sp. NC1633]